MSLILSGCGGQALSEREIIRGVLFSKKAEGYSACLVLADKGENANGTTICAADGTTVAQALACAEQALQGDAYYGLLDLVALPSDVELSSAQDIGDLLYQNAQPAPELSVFVLDSSLAQSWQEQGGELYQNMKSLEQVYKVHCGLQQLFTQSEVCALPVYAPESGYDFMLLTEDAPPIRCYGLAEAQLAALLCGQTSYLRGIYASGQAFCEARAQVTAEDNLIQIHLRDVSLTSLNPSLGDDELAGLLENELKKSFDDLYLRIKQKADPFHLDFWQGCLYGPGATMQDPSLEILLE